MEPETEKQEKERLEKDKIEEYLKQFDEFKDKDLKTYVYARVSTNKQTLSGQLKEIYNFCVNNRMYPPRENIYYDWAKSGKIDWDKRELNKIVERVRESKKTGIMIIPELSRLGRNMGQINGLIEELVNKYNITIIDIKNNLKMDGSLQSKILSTIMNICAELERELTRERIKKGMDTNEAKERIKNRKVKSKNKLDKHVELIKQKLSEGMNANQISKLEEINCNKAQMYKYIKDKLL